MTSLIDVAFTLLVIFIITAPIMQGGVEISVPRARRRRSPRPRADRHDRPEGQIFIGETATTWEEFGAALPGRGPPRGQARNVYLRADEGVPYGRVLQVLGAMKALDVVTVGLVAEPETARGAVGSPTAGAPVAPRVASGGRE
jgi:biopolymer transport protein TolR